MIYLWFDVKTGAVSMDTESQKEKQDVSVKKERRVHWKSLSNGDIIMLSPDERKNCHLPVRKVNSNMKPRKAEKSCFASMFSLCREVEVSEKKNIKRNQKRPSQIMPKPN